MPDDGHIRRSMLFMPGNDERKIRKGAGLDVDSVILDLEDAVALTQKAEAREVAHEMISGVDFGTTERVIRINPASTTFWQDDLQATIAAKPDAYVLPKVESATELVAVCGLISRLEQDHDMTPGSTKVLGIIETALGVVNLREIAQADPRLVALVFGAEDLAGSLGAIRTESGHEVQYGRAALVMHAAAYGLQAIDSPYVHYKDIDGLRDETQTALELGYTGKLCIHPAQVGPVTDVFTPSQESFNQAHRLIAAHEAHQDAGAGVFAIDGKMIDMPMIKAAERVLARGRAAGMMVTTNNE